MQTEPDSVPSLGSRLVIVCGLPGSGKTTHAKSVERSLRAIRLCPDEWMSALEIDLWDEKFRDRMERLQWKLAREILSVGHSVVIEWGTWARSERDALRIGARELGAAVDCISWMPPPRCSTRGFARGIANRRPLRWRIL